MKLVVVGKKEECLGFALAGADTLEIEEDEAFVPRMRKLFDDADVGVIAVSERYFDRVSEHFSKRLQKNAIPSVVFIPSIAHEATSRDLKGFLGGILGIKL